MDMKSNTTTCRRANEVESVVGAKEMNSTETEAESNLQKVATRKESKERTRYSDMSHITAVLRRLTGATSAAER